MGPAALQCSLTVKASHCSGSSAGCTRREGRPHVPTTCPSLPNRRMEEARKARMSGADSLLIKKELIDPALAKVPGDPVAGLKRLVEVLGYMTNMDD